MHHLARRLAIATALAAVALFGAGTATAADRTVVMSDFDYSPGSVTIAPGDTVTWRNDGDAPHDAAGSGWSTELLLPGQTGAVTFAKAGTYAYTCTIHPHMSGRVVVRAASTGGGGGGSEIPNPPTDTAPETTTAIARLADGAPAAELALGAAAIAFLLVLARQSRRAA